MPSSAPTVDGTVKNTISVQGFSKISKLTHEFSPHEWFNILFDGIKQDKGIIEIRCLSDDRQVDRRWIEWPFSNSTIPALQTLPIDKNVYYGISLRLTEGIATDKGVFPTPLLWADFDLKASKYVRKDEEVKSLTEERLIELARKMYTDVVKKCEELSIPPLAIIYSGHGLQVIWARVEATMAKDTKSYNSALASIFGDDFGADPKVVNPERILRLPGTYNVKNPIRPIKAAVWHVNHDSPRVSENQLIEIVKTTREMRKVVIDTERELARKETFHGRFLRILESKCVEISNTTQGQRNDTLNKAAYEFGPYVSDNFLTKEEVVSHLARAAKLAGLDDLEIQATINSGLSAGMLPKKPSRDEKYNKKNDTEDSKNSLDIDTSRADIDNPKRLPAGTRVLEYVLADGGELWRDQAGGAYLTVHIQSHLEHYPLPSRMANDYIQVLFYSREGQALNSQSQKEAITLMQAIGRREGVEIFTAVRATCIQGNTYLDLGSSDWACVEVSKGSWRIITPDECPIRFIRPPGFRVMPIPVEGGNLSDLGIYLNTDERGFIMCVAWLLAALSGKSPYPVLALSGEQGTGKSTAATVLKQLIDPQQANRRRVPKEERDLFISARSSHILNYDNLSSIPEWLSDAMCVMSTGGAFTARTLYSDNEETVLEAVRPIIINGIPDLLSRPDLAERALNVLLHRIDPKDRMTEEKFSALFASAQARILGALLTALAGAYARLEATELSEPPRMADFARLIVAAEPDLPWATGSFLAAYGDMQDEMSGIVLESEPVADALRRLLDIEQDWRGTVKQLLVELTRREYPDAKPPQIWPRTAKALGGSLRRLAPALSKLGYEVKPVGRQKDGEHYHLARISD